MPCRRTPGWRVAVRAAGSGGLTICVPTLRKALSHRRRKGSSSSSRPSLATSGHAWPLRVKRRQHQSLPLYPPDIQPVNHHQLSSPPQNQHFPHYQTHSEPATSISSAPTTPTAFSFQTTPTLHVPTTPTPPSLHSSHCTTPTTLNSSHHTTTPMLLNPTPPNASPLPSPHTPVYPTLPLFDFSASASNPSTSTTNSSFFSPRTPPFLQTPPRFKRLHRQLDCENSNNSSFNFNPANATATSGSTTSSFAFPFSPLLRSSSFGHTTAATSMPISTHYPSFASKPFCFDPSTSLRTVGSHLDLGQLASIPDYVYPTNEYQNLGESSGGSGLLEDLLEEAQAMAGSSNGFGRQTCFSSQEEKQVLDGFCPWGDSSSVVLRPKEETADQMQTAHEDLSQQDNVIPSPMQVHEWYTGDGREASNGQSSVVTDDNLGLDMHQLASLCPMDTTADHGRVPSWDNFPGIH
ncbi:hypothetical protein SLEP1_g50076 [Rubroshorea leprosula]|uniref:Uncharacterized protein n=1 Tax=Rubroshorea leprosula TaxID=152421 RepID=A0AAV5M1X8_9ROSI|nr:hypothetical protein SLEP1_g50076 [Rubroshorea leprosula]